jgi:CBS domain-containing protein
MEQVAQVADVMTREVAATRPDARLSEAGRLMRELHISGLPVVGPEDRVVGVLSEKDLVRKLDRSLGISKPRGLLDLLFGSSPKHGPSLLEQCRRQLDNTYVREAMTAPAVTVPPTASTHDAARAMLLDRINRLPVVDEKGRLLGVVTRADLVHASASGRGRRRGALTPRPTRPRRAPVDPYGDA